MLTGSMPRVYIKTYGCQMNERDSEQVSQMFVEKGYTMTRTEADADVVLINTCSVRDQAEQKALGKMGMVRYNRRGRLPLVTGFMGCGFTHVEDVIRMSPDPTNAVLVVVKAARHGDSAGRRLMQPVAVAANDDLAGDAVIQIGRWDGRNIHLKRTELLGDDFPDQADVPALFRIEILWKLVDRVRRRCRINKVSLPPLPGRLAVKIQVQRDRCPRQAAVCRHCVGK